VHPRHEGAKVLLVYDLAAGQRHGTDAASMEATLRHTQQNSCIINSSSSSNACFWTSCHFRPCPLALALSYILMSPPQHNKAQCMAYKHVQGNHDAG
jgi:hypothetical protein